MARQPKINEERIAPPQEERITQSPPQAQTPPQQEDYLRQYQFKREVPLGDPRTDPPKGSKAEAMKKKLLSDPRVRVVIPLKNDGSDKAKRSVNLNGYRLDFPKGVYLDLPQGVQDALEDGERRTQEALNPKELIAGNAELEAALA